ncbi:MAG: ribonuclease P protein component [Chlamydiales bacterium]|nr:ribonuclease P protein component [Chlamydiales bacterium]
MVGKLLCVDYHLGSSKTTRLGITAPSRYGNAPERNRFKRLVREVFRKNLCQFPSNLELNVAPRQRAKKASEADIRQELLDILCSIPIKN